MEILSYLCNVENVERKRVKREVSGEEPE